MAIKRVDVVIVIIMVVVTVTMADDQVCDTLTSVKKVNKTDAVTLLSTFGVSVMH